jgi:hypothetical protein
MKLASSPSKIPYSITMQGARFNKSNDDSSADCIVKWLHNFAAMHIHDPTQPQVILQVATKTQVYGSYEEDFITLQENSPTQRFFPRAASGQAKLPTRSYFFKIWEKNSDTKRFKVRRYLPLSQCVECVQFIDERRGCHTPETRLAIIAQERLHHDFIRREKSSYYTRRKQAICQAITEGRQQFGSCIMDACTQAVLALPHFVEIDKTSNEASKIPMHVMAALVHGFRPYAFLFTDNFKHGANLTIECLHHVLLDMHRHFGSLPRTFYLQLDNTTKQCKNKYVVAYLGLLVAWDMLERVVISFLPVGHTHEDIDQFFSILAKYLRCNPCLDRDDLEKAIHICYHAWWQKKSTKTHKLETAANISDWLQPYINSLPEITKPLQMHLFKNDAKHVVVQQRDQCGLVDAKWKSMAGP